MAKFAVHTKNYKDSTLRFDGFTALGYDLAWNYAIERFQASGLYGVYIVNEDGHVIWACDGEGCRNFDVEEV